MVQNILLIGASGYLGSFVLRALLNEGHAITATFNKAKRPGKISSEQWIHLDITKPKSLRKVKKNFDAIIYLASSLSNDYYTVVETDIKGLHNVLAAQFAPYLLFCSSIDVYGLSLKESTTENAIPQPKFWYGLGKLYCEKAIDIYTHENILQKKFILRVPFVLGIHDKIAVSFWGRLILSALKKKTIILNENSFHKISISGFNWVPAISIAETYTQSLSLQLEGCYNSISYFHTWKEFFEALGEITNCKPVYVCEHQQGEGIVLIDHGGKLCDSNIRSRLSSVDTGTSLMLLNTTLKEICAFFMKTGLLK